MAEDADAKRRQKPTAGASAAAVPPKSRIIQLNRAAKKDIPAGLSQNASLRSSSVQSSASTRAGGSNNNNSSNNFSERASGGGGSRSRPPDTTTTTTNNNNNTGGGGGSGASAWRSAPGTY
ncbi:Nuclear receptor coregulator [Globisporangium polare]